MCRYGYNHAVLPVCPVCGPCFLGWVAASATATTGEVNYDDAVPMGAFGGGDE